MKKIIWIFILVFMVSFPMITKAATKYGYSNVTGGSFSVRTSASSSASLIGYLYGGA